MGDLFETAHRALDRARALCPGGRPEGLAPGDLVALSEALGTLRRAADAALAPVAAEIGRQSRAELGRDSLARKNGFRSPAAMISTVVGTTAGEAMRAMRIGESTAPGTTLTGDQTPPKNPHVAAALNSATIGALAAGAIVAACQRLALRADAAAIDRLEKTLVEAAPRLPLEALQKLILRAEAHLDPDGVEPREAERRGDRALSIHEDRDGMLVLSGRFDPETGAPVKAAVEGLVSGMLRRRHESSRDTAGTREADAVDGAPEDVRTPAQMRADALADICRHALGCDSVPQRPSTTVVVRMSLSDLDAGTGSATIDGIAAPVSVSTARRMAGDGQIIPCVLGGDSEILDWGRAKRLFTPAQKLALVERDGGCAHCGLPPGMTVVHHLRWWQRDAGPTDLDNGILLCTSCHHRIHDDGWEIRITGPGMDAAVWFIPPPWLDPERTPRLGGRRRFDLVA
jgi:hypothetical protein